jgi:hypothetical protein
MKNSSLAVFVLLIAAFCAAPIRAQAANGFMGHYGYLLTLDETYSANSSFQGPIEVTDLFPSACAGLKKRMDCAKLGMVELTVLPKKIVFAEIHAKDFDAYIATTLRGAKDKGLKTRVRREKRAGFPAVVIEMSGHPQLLNTMLLIEGSKVYYRFKYNDKAGAKTASAIANSLKEIAPHDNPPKSGAL